MKENIVMKSRVRLARNLNNYPFPNRLDKECAIEIIEKVKNAFMNSSLEHKEEFDFYKIEDLDQSKKMLMVEEHIISPDLAENDKSAVIVKKDKTVSIMINEEDHIRIQTMCDDLNLENAYNIANEIDDLLESNLEYAFSTKLGYLTSCPTNTGTGMRASVMMHLPALSQLGYMDELYKISSQIGIAIRGIYGERTEALGNIYQISNQLTLGRTESNIIENVSGLTKDAISKEVKAREILQKKLGIKLEDKIFRSIGTLENSRVMSSSEAMSHLSNIKMGIEMNYIKKLDLKAIERLMIGIQPAHQSIMYKSDDVKNRDINRATYIRETLEKLRGGINYELQ
ncbi:protein arginine kinase [Clostridioides difficile]|nr:protein arginine kinase [Clostridioides difficile]